MCTYLHERERNILLVLRWPITFCCIVGQSDSGLSIVFTMERTSWCYHRVFFNLTHWTWQRQFAWCRIPACFSPNQSIGRIHQSISNDAHTQCQQWIFGVRCLRTILEHRPKMIKMNCICREWPALLCFRNGSRERCPSIASLIDVLLYQLSHTDEFLRVIEAEALTKIHVCTINSNGNSNSNNTDEEEEKSHDVNKFYTHITMKTGEREKKMVSKMSKESSTEKPFYLQMQFVCAVFVTWSVCVLHVWQVDTSLTSLFLEKW